MVWLEVDKAHSSGLVSFCFEDHDVFLFYRVEVSGGCGPEGEFAFFQLASSGMGPSCPNSRNWGTLGGR